MNAKKKWIVVVCTALASVGILLGSGLFYLKNGNPFARKQWKDAALASIYERTENPEWVVKEMSKLSAAPEGFQPEKAWLTKDLIVMANGEWIAYSSICRKEDFGICDLFIGRGSDRKWYYSTYHFCIGMYGMLMQYHQPDRPQPESIAAFAERHALKEFDGKSDVCLQKTWP